jgi:hypothetical protein
MDTSKQIAHADHRTTARTVGILYIIGTVAGILSLVFAGSNLEGPDALVKISANENQVIAGAFFVLIMGLALAMIPAVMFPVLKRHHEGLAVGYIVFRGALETVSYIGMTVTWLLLVNIGRESINAGTQDLAYYQTLGAVILRGNDSIRSILEIVFPLGALMFYTALYRSSLLPRWVSGWGLAAAVIWLAVGVLGMFHLITPLSTLQMILSLPIALQEMVMAVWLIVKGFNVSPFVEKRDSVQAAMSPI